MPASNPGSLPGRASSPPLRRLALRWKAVGILALRACPLPLSFLRRSYQKNEDVEVAGIGTCTVMLVESLSFLKVRSAESGRIFTVEVQADGALTAVEEAGWSDWADDGEEGDFAQAKGVFSRLW